jgi:hypothetical protein
MEKGASRRNIPVRAIKRSWKKKTRVSTTTCPFFSLECRNFNTGEYYTPGLEAQQTVVSPFRARGDIIGGDEL